MSLRRRWGANLGWLTLLALLCAGAALMITASPRVANRHTDQGLREAVTSLPYLARDISYLIDTTGDPPLRPGQAPAYSAQLRNEFAPPLRDRIDEFWYATQVAAPATGPDLARTAEQRGLSGGFTLTLRDQSGAQSAARLVDGAWPSNSTVIGDGIEAVVSTEVARTFGLRVGSALALGAGPSFEAEVADDGTVVVGPAEDDELPPLPVVIVGVFEPENRADPVWDEQPEAFEPYAPVGLDSPEPWRGVLFTDTEGLILAAPGFADVQMTFRYRLDETTITVADLPDVIEAVFDARTQDYVDAIAVTTLDSALSRFADRVRSASALLAVVQAGVGVTLFGLVVLAAIAATDRRHGELALLRARGASLQRIGARVLVESGPVVALAVAAGSALSLRVPGRPGSTEWLVVAFAVAAALTAPVLAMVGHRRISVSGSRADLARPRVTPRRITAEVTLVAIAVLGVLLLRRRGLGSGFRSPEPTGSETDLYLAVLPALVAGAAAVAALRLLPFPLHMLARATARTRGAVAFLGLARAGRAAPASAGPVAVLVVAVSVGTFCAAVAGSVSAARDRVAELAVPGDAIVQGGRFPLATAAEFAAAPGVTAVAPLTVAPNQLVGGGLITQALSGTAVVVVDATALDRVLRSAGNPQTVPEALLTATPGEAVPAVVSPDVAEALGPAVGGVSVQGRTVSFTVAAVADIFPGVAGYRRFVVVPRQALPQGDAGLDPTAFAIAGSGLDEEALRAIGDNAQRAWFSDVLGTPFDGVLEQPTRVLTYAKARADLESGGVDRVLGFTYGVGLGAGLLLALLAVGFAVATGARARGQALSRLRTMGLAPGQGRRLLAYELLPLILLGALVGSGVGTALPVLLGPALGLSAFSDGGEVLFTLDPRLPALAFGLVLVAVIVAMAVEASMNRRARLGAVLRVGGES